MTSPSSNTLTGNDLSMIRDAVPTLDLLAIRSLRRAGFQIVRDSEAVTSESQDRRWGGNEHAVSSAA